MAKLPLLPSEDETLDLKSSAFRDKRTGRYTRMVNLEDIATSIRDTLRAVLSIDVTTSQIAKRAELIETNLNILSFSIVAQRQAKVAKQEEKPSIAITQKKATYKPDSIEKILGYLGLFTLLKNNRLMEFIGRFFRTLLSNLGVSNSTLDKLSLAATLAKEALKMYLGYKVIRSVADAFLKVKKLAEVTGLLSILTSKESARLSVRERMLRGRNSLGKFASIFRSFDRFKRVSKLFFKKIIRQWKGVVKNTITRVVTAVKVITSLKSWKRLVISGLQLMRKGVQAIKAATAFTLVGYLIGATVDAVLGTALDYFLFEENQPGKSTGSFVIDLLKKNVVQSVTFGLVSGEPQTAAQREQQQKNIQPLVKASGGIVDAERIAATFPKNLTKQQFVTLYDKKYLKLRAMQSSSVVRSIEDNREVVWNVYNQHSAAPTAVQVQSSRPVAAPTAVQVQSSRPVEVSSKNITEQLIPPTAESNMQQTAVPVQNDVPQKSISDMSQQVTMDKRVKSSQTVTPVILTNINNNTTVLPDYQRIRSNPGVTVFSDTVGF